MPLPYDLETGQVFFRPPKPHVEWPHVTDWGYLEWSSWLSQQGWTPPQIQQYLQVDRYTYGLGLRRHQKEPLTWFYLPVPSAIPFHASKTLNVLYGGAAGGTKSHSIRHDAYRHGFALPGYRSILMRRTFEELKRNHLDKAVGECHRINSFFGQTMLDLVASEHELRFTFNQSKIIFGHCQNEGDEERYLGDEYDDGRFDEAATFTKKQIVGVSGRLRSTKKGIRARSILTSNPGGAHTLYLKDMFIDRSVPYEENPRYKAKDYEFISSRLYDNPYLMDPDGTFTTYEDRLFAYDEQRRRQLLMGDWSALTGQFFPEFITEQHRPGCHVANMPIPPGCKIERWIDWGYDPHPGVCLWVACLPNGRLYVFYEWVFNGTGREKRVASEVAKQIRQYTLDDVLPMVHTKRVTRSIADPSMFMSDGHIGESYGDTFARFGCALIKGDNERVMGWGRLRHWFKLAPDGLPWMVFHPRCAYSIRTIPSLIRDKHDPDDVDTSGEDHAADPCRYGVMARPTPTKFSVEKPKVSDWTPAGVLAMMRGSEVRRFGQVR